MTERAGIERKRRWTDWLGVILAAGLAGFVVGGYLLDFESFAWFLVTMAVYLVIAVVFCIWWLTRRAFNWWGRLLVLVAAVAGPVGVWELNRRGIQQPFQLAFLGLPLLLLVWAGWEAATRRRTAEFRVVGLVICLLLTWCTFLLVRITGLRGNLRADLHWRWTRTGEELFLAQHPGGASTASTMPAGQPISLQPGDWPGFRGPDRNAVVHGIRIELDWEHSPPRILWKQRVGPAWSSMAVVDNRVFTQEQRADQEAVVCRDARSGEELWVSQQSARFDEAMSGPGPRATPTFANGRIYALGATGTLSCLDAGTGRLIWSRDIRSDANAAVPIWGYSGSPLVLGDRVIVFAGGEGKKGLLAYPLDGGAPVWAADAGKTSYASPQQLAVGTERQVLMFASEGLFALDPASGSIRWSFPLKPPVGIPASIQACEVAPGSLVIGEGAAFGAQRLDIGGDHGPVSRRWITTRLKPNFSDMVYDNGFLYGFDESVFCCVDASSGQRRWREGQYGAGQVLLLADQGVMIVTSEDGQVFLLRCNPAQHKELGHVPAVSGKAWNHPALVQNRLYVRSDAEMACIELQAPKQP